MNTGFWGGLLMVLMQVVICVAEVVERSSLVMDCGATELIITIQSVYTAIEGIYDT